MTDSSEARARDVAFEFEQMRLVFSTVLRTDDVETGPPLTIVAARDYDTFRRLNPALNRYQAENLAGWFQEGWERQFAAIRLDSWTDQNQVVVYHEYAHSILHANTHWLPTWLDEGLAEFYGYTRFEGEKVYIGAPSERIGAVRAQTMIPVEAMLDIRNSVTGDERRTQLFYAESWAMVHYMIFGPGMENGQKLGVFLKKLQEREPQTQAFGEVFGDPKAFNSALSSYVFRFTFPSGTLAADTRVDRTAFTARVLTPAEVKYEIGCVQNGSHQKKSGRVLIEEALQLDPKLAGAHEELAYALFEEGKDAEAEAEWRKALVLNPDLVRSSYALAMNGKPLMRRSREELLGTQAALQHVVALAPRFASAYEQLALIEWRLGLMQKAFGDARQAEALAPSRAGYRTVTGNILLQGKQPALAAEYSRYVATHWRGSDHDEAVDLWKRVPAESRGPGPDLVPETPAGATVVRGSIATLTCSNNPGEKFSVTLQPDGAGAGPLKLIVQGRFLGGWSDTLWWGSDHFSFCHHMVGRSAVVAYKPQTNNAGDLLDLEVRDDWPAASPGAAPNAAAPAAKPAVPEPAQAAVKAAPAPATP